MEIKDTKKRICHPFVKYTCKIKYITIMKSMKATPQECGLRTVQQNINVTFFFG